MERIQLLAPAGTFGVLVSAINNGADAVYLGSKLFNARRLAGNFNADDLKKAFEDSQTVQHYFLNEALLSASLHLSLMGRFQSLLI